ncbi:MAG: Gfo/Idh/MocA family oxidoreductase [Planctomycetota bacterium]|nr:Gfo/Idh/MocA family oxidoreductase [Planctomycetota bacterium]
MLRIGLVGCGTHANWAVVPAIKAAAPRAALVAVADVNAQNLAKIEAGPAKRYSDHRQMIAVGGLDAVYVATLANTHADITCDALAAGLHVVCEKPMATSVEDCTRMTQAAAKARRVLAVNFETRYHAEILQIRRWIDEGHLGRVEAIHIQDFWDGHKVWGEIGARRKRLTDLAGALDCGIHKADWARYWCGGSWKNITALGRWFDEDVRFAPHIGVLGELDSGQMVTLNASFAYSAYIKPHAYSHVLTVVGSQGVINHFEDRVAPSVVRLTSEALTATHEVTATGHADVMTKLIRDLADAAEGKPIPREMARGEDGLAAQIFVEEANKQAVARR